MVKFASNHLYFTATRRSVRKSVVRHHVSHMTFPLKIAMSLYVVLKDKNLSAGKSCDLRGDAPHFSSVNLKIDKMLVTRSCKDGDDILSFMLDPVVHAHCYTVCSVCLYTRLLPVELLNRLSVCLTWSVFLSCFFCFSCRC